MHELSLMRDLVRKAETVVREHGGSGASAVSIRRGSLSSMSTAHIEQHFEWVAHGTLLDGATLLIEDGDDVTNAQALDLVLTSVDVVGGA